ncbi:translesion DNA synthesis-associated protein ImuA [Ramlibacter sp. XY19]|uniref:translesion DNA synthesis-associated protein ImuA n=1 Tax=Ramlibacter paludis TaxID=2908000 RepID=UPI0023DA27AE|nr:translesion DNA synthesis-associated protein ImuA [Ramlibacter paludis]MCG2592929.1 translesion DNA synthesis-associated protein ImuA [Ramlibacter paludis]
MTAAALSSSPLVLPQHVWRGRELAQAPERVLPTGHAALDQHLSGAGWPLGCLIEVLQPQPQQHVWRLLAPALAHCMHDQPGPVVLVNAPCEPFGPGLQGHGVQPGQLLCVRSEKASARLWAAEQALRCADVSAVLAWLPVAKNEELRRLHLCAQQYDKWLVVFRGVAAAQQSSPARLRLLVEGVEQMEVRILKRRGPPLLQPVVLAAQHPRLAALLAARKSRPAVQPAAVSLSSPGGSHVLDRAASVVE